MICHFVRVFQLGRFDNGHCQIKVSVIVGLPEFLHVLEYNLTSSCVYARMCLSVCLLSSIMEL